VGGEHVAQLGHAPTQRRRRLDQADVQTDLRQVYRRTHAGHAPTNDHYGVPGVFPGRRAVITLLIGLHYRINSSLTTTIHTTTKYRGEQKTNSRGSNNHSLIVNDSGNRRP
jgi:hypothetical protein